jgi:uncharacterized repeat protein (TIGR03803 family)
LWLAIVLACWITIAVADGQSQTYTVLHVFSGANDGANPLTGVAIDRSGNLYGSTNFGGFRDRVCAPLGCGLLFKLTDRGAGWILNPIYTFQGGDDGAYPGPLAIASDGTLYGATGQGGHSNDGIVFRLQPPTSACTTALCSWSKTLLHEFSGGGFGANPYGALRLTSGNIYGVTIGGGSSFPYGTAYELTPGNGGWAETILNANLTSPDSGPVLDSTGNIYGTTSVGGDHNKGTVYQLVSSGSGWTLNTLVSFGNGNGSVPEGGLVMDPGGNLFGTTSSGGANDVGTVFELSQQNGTWTLTTLYDFPAQQGQPMASLTLDAAGNIYGTTNQGFGSVFKMTHGSSGWTFSVLHQFAGGANGRNPDEAAVTLDANGNIFGTTGGGGDNQNCVDGCGVVWEITP